MTRIGIAALGLAVAACGTEVDGVAIDAARSALDARVDPPPDGASSPDPDAARAIDRDGDGLDDGDESAWAAAYLPFLSLHPDDGCALGGLVVRVRPHPDAPSLVHIVYDHLFQNDCGLNGHVGDNEAFGVTIDPSVPPPAGILAVVAISHQGTPCERTSSCGVCPGMDACVVEMGRPVVFSSKDKHGGYVDTTTCQFSCFDQCSLAATSAAPPIVNAGEPDAHLVENLTAQGFITAANGWTETALHDHDPWGAADFGSAGNIAGDLVDPAFTPPACP